MVGSPCAPSSSASPSKEVVFHCEYAPSGRAKCRVCQNSVMKNSLRLAVSLPFAEPSVPEPQDDKVTKQRRIAAEAPQWCHANCFRRFRASAKWWREHVYPAARWIGIFELSRPDQAQVRSFVTACQRGEEPPLFRLDEGIHKRSETTDTRVTQHEATRGKACVTMKEERKGSRPHADEESRLKPRKRRGSSPPGEGEGSAVPSNGIRRSKDGEGKAKCALRQGQVKAMQRKRRRTPNDEVEDVEARKTNDVEFAGDSVGEESIGLALTARQQQDIEKQLEKAEKENAATLRSLLRLNHQKVSGPKEELAHRVAECRVLGATPKCPQCREGFLRFDANTGEYRCPGYVNEEGEYERCSFKSNNVERLQWKE